MNNHNIERVIGRLEGQVQYIIEEIKELRSDTDHIHNQIKNISGKEMGRTDYKCLGSIDWRLIGIILTGIMIVAGIIWSEGRNLLS